MTPSPEAWDQQLSPEAGVHVGRRRHSILSSEKEPLLSHASTSESGSLTLPLVHQDCSLILPEPSGLAYQSGTLSFDFSLRFVALGECWTPGFLGASWWCLFPEVCSLPCIPLSPHPSCQREHR